MFIKQADLLWGLDKNFIKNLMDASVKELHKKGGFLFREGDAADSFYIMLRGRVRLSSGHPSRTIHIVCHPGECFGWSCLVGREAYSSSAEFTENTTMMRFNNKEIIELCESDPVNGMHFYRKLAGVLGHRLILGYCLEDSRAHDETAPSYGTGQILSSEVVTG